MCYEGEDVMTEKQRAENDNMMEKDMMPISKVDFEFVKLQVFMTNLLHE